MPRCILVTIVQFTFRGLVVHVCDSTSFSHVSHGVRWPGLSRGGLLSSVLRPSLEAELQGETPTRPTIETSSYV